jgi:hypothetical protein
MSVVAVIFPDASAFLGPVVVTPTGFNWRLIAAVRDTVTNEKITLQGYSADTLDADSLTQVRDKMIAATKTAAIAAGFATLNVAVLNSMAIVNPVP